MFLVCCSLCHLHWKQHGAFFCFTAEGFSFTVIPIIYKIFKIRRSEARNRKTWQKRRRLLVEHTVYWNNLLEKSWNNHFKNMKQLQKVVLWSFVTLMYIYIFYISKFTVLCCKEFCKSFTFRSNCYLNSFESSPISKHFAATFVATTDQRSVQSICVERHSSFIIEKNEKIEWLFSINIYMATALI